MRILLAILLLAVSCTAYAQDTTLYKEWSYLKLDKHVSLYLPGKEIPDVYVQRKDEATFLYTTKQWRDMAYCEVSTYTKKRFFELYLDDTCSDCRLLRHADKLGLNDSVRNMIYDVYTQVDTTDTSTPKPVFGRGIVAGLPVVTEFRAMGKTGNRVVQRFCLYAYSKFYQVEIAHSIHADPAYIKDLWAAVKASVRVVP